MLSFLIYVSKDVSPGSAQASLAVKDYANLTACVMMQL